MKVKWPILSVGVGGTLALVFLLWQGFGKDPTALPDVKTGTQADPFTLVDLDGNPWTLEKLQGKPVFINFWSTWCGPCKMEHPMLLQAATHYPDVQFLGIIYNDKAKAVEIQMKKPPYDALMGDLGKQGIPYPNLQDPDGSVAIDYGVGGVPESFFVDRTGKIAHKQVGPLNAATAKQWLDHIRRQ